MSYICICSHAYDEHAESGLQSCEVEGCLCATYDDDPDAEV